MRSYAASSEAKAFDSRSRSWRSRSGLGDDEDQIVHATAVQPEEEAILDQYFEHMTNRDLHEIWNAVHVPLKISRNTRLGLHLGGVSLDGTSSGEPPFPDTKVTLVEPDGLIGAWNRDAAGQVEKQVRESTETEEGAKLVRISSVSDQRQRFSRKGSDGVKYLQKVCSHAGNSNETARLEVVFTTQVRYEFTYKGRACTGSAIHVAALHGAGAPILQTLIDSQADPEEEATFMKQGQPGNFQAIHLAAGRGHVGVIKMLLDAGVNPDSKTQQNWKLNYTALHEAAFFQQSAAVMLLLSRKADTRALNLSGQTALHIAALQGIDASGEPTCCKMLVAFEADIQAKDTRGKTPLDLAMENGRYPYSRLYVLTGTTFDELLEVARSSPGAASELLRDHRSNRNAIHSSWIHALSQEASEEDIMTKWISLVGISPQAGEAVIEALSVVPEVRNATHHSLPRRASIPEGKGFLCEYMPSSIWEYSTTTEEEQYPDWHQKLCPGLEAPKKRAGPATAKGQGMLRKLYAFVTGQSRDKSKSELHAAIVEDKNHMNQAEGLKPTLPGQDAGGELVPVQVMIVKLPGIICPSVMHVLSEIEDRNIFSKIGVRAIIGYTWEAVVQYHYYAKTTQRVVMLALLFIWVLKPPPENSITRKAFWSIFFMLVHLELLNELLEVRGYIIKLRQPELYFRKKKNLFDYMSISSGLALLYMTLQDYKIEDWHIFLAGIILGRWIMLTWTCRAFGWAGQRILPILQASFVPMSGIMLVTTFIFAGFWHAFAALKTGARGADNDQLEVLIGTIRLLLLGDGDGVNTVLQLYDAVEGGSLVTFVFLCAAVTVFCICILNLFIAVHGEAYDTVQEVAHISFLQERAAISLQCLLMPKWPPAGWGSDFYFSNPVRVAVGVYVLSFALWIILLLPDELHASVASAALLLGAFLAECILAQLPWEKEKAHHHFLWVCHRKDYEEEEHIEESAAGEGGGGRLGSVKSNARILHNKMEKNLAKLMGDFDRKSRGLEGRLGYVDACLQHLETKIEDAISEIQLPPVVE